jgi:hypothetical protein
MPIGRHLRTSTALEIVVHTPSAVNPFHQSVPAQLLQEYSYCESFNAAVQHITHSYFMGMVAIAVQGLGTSTT